MSLATLGFPGGSQAEDSPGSGPPRGDVRSTPSTTAASSRARCATTGSTCPKQYDPAKPACLYVSQDGVQFNAPAVFDELIDKKEMPVTIGVFVMHGRVKALVRQAPSTASIAATNTTAWATTTPGSCSRSCCPRSRRRPPPTAGRSSSRTTATTAASAAPAAARSAPSRRPGSGPTRSAASSAAIGTYVGLRGGNVYPTLIRKYEPKPIRVFLQDGSNDLNIYGGDWWMANQEMERALHLRRLRGQPRLGRRAATTASTPREIFPDAMRWLWKDWPEPVKAGAGSPQLQEILIPGEGWKLVAEGYKFTEGPAANAKGEVFFNDIPNSKTYKIGLDGKVSLFVADTKKATARRSAPTAGSTRSLAATSQVLAYDAERQGRRSIAEGFRGNDLVVRHDGGIYVTNPDAANRSDPSKVWYISPHGREEGRRHRAEVPQRHRALARPVAALRRRLPLPLGLQLPDPARRLARRTSRSYFHLHVPDTGRRQRRRRHARRPRRPALRGHPHGHPGLRPGRPRQLHHPDAQRHGSPTSASAARLRHVYATCGDRVYKRSVKAHGANAFEAPIKPAPPRL